MHSLSHASKPMLRLWLYSGLLHGFILLGAVLYDLASHDSLYLSANRLSQAESINTTSVSNNGMNFLALSLEQYPMTEPQQLDFNPTDVLVEAAKQDAREVSSDVPVAVPIEVLKEEPIAVKKVQRPAAKKSTTTEVLTANTIQSASDTHRVAAQPIQGARPDHAYSPKPAYPLALRDLGVSGVVWLRVMVDENGRPKEIELAKGSGYRLFDEAALRAVQHWRFIPAKNNHLSLASWVEFSVRFELNS